MTIKPKEFLHLLKSHRLMDASLPHLDLENQFLKQWELDDDGANYLRYYERDAENRGSKFFEMFAIVRADWLQAAERQRCVDWLAPGAREMAARASARRSMARRQG